MLTFVKRVAFGIIKYILNDTKLIIYGSKQIILVTLINNELMVDKNHMVGRECIDALPYNVMGNAFPSYYVA